MTKVKICGIKRIEDVAYVNKYMPEYIGFVFAPGRKRTVSFEQAQMLREIMSPDIKSVGVFVDAEIDEVVRLVEADVINIVQLHGHEDEAYVDALKKICKKPFEIIKAFVVKTKETLEIAKTFPCDYLLLDGGLGQGETFDWSLIQGVTKPFFLAGGLDATNVSVAINQVQPYAVDVSSSVETDGCKDEAKIRNFIDKVRREL